MTGYLFLALIIHVHCARSVNSILRRETSVAKQVVKGCNTESTEEGQTYNCQVIDSVHSGASTP